MPPNAFVEALEQIWMSTPSWLPPSSHPFGKVASKQFEEPAPKNVLGTFYLRSLVAVGLVKQGNTSSEAYNSIQL